MLVTLIGAALAADPWLIDARPGRAFAPASLLDARPTLRFQVDGEDVAGVEIRRSDGQTCQLPGAVVDLSVHCQKLFATPVAQGEWALRVGAGSALFALRTGETWVGYHEAGEGLSFPFNPGYVLSRFVDEGGVYWISDPQLSAAEGGFEAQRLNDSLSVEGLTLDGVWSFDGTQALSWEFDSRAAAVSPTPEPAPEPPSCPDLRGDSLVICYWVGAADPLYMSASSGIIPANTPIEVWVFNAPAGAEVRASGTAGLSSGRVDLSEGIGRVQSGEKGLDDMDGAAPPLRRQFSPRLPGAVSLDLVVGDRKTQIAELFVVEPVIGAVRLGIGLSNVTDARYAAITAPGSLTPEIALSASDRFAPELVVGFAPYVFDRGGRIYAPGYHHRRVAPYIGLGIVSVGEDDSPALTPLKSLYLGGEFELVRSSSLTLAFVMRRVTRLAEPYTIGSPFVGTAVPTFTSYQPGLALVFNVSPAMFQVSQNPFNILGDL